MIRLTIKNYRCFAEPAAVDVSPGYIAFVGVNNAGKSALIRFLVEFRELFQIIKNPPQLQPSLVGAGADPLSIQHVFDPEETFSNLNERPIELEIEFLSERTPDNPLAVTKAAITIDRSLRWHTRLFQNEQLVVISSTTSSGPPNILTIEGRGPVDLGPLIELAQLLANTLYIGPFRNIINVGANTTYFDIQIGDAFVAQFRDLKTGPNKRNSIGIQRLIDDVRRIFEFDSLAIEPSNDNRSLHITVNGKPFKQHELGSGLSQFIVVLANAAIQKPSIILIDEPELNLHPRLQLDFLTTLGNYASNGIWFSTHSLGLARSAAERIYSVQRVSDGNSIVTLLEGTPRAAEFLGELSFSTQRELGADKVLLVEGPTEVKAFQQLLRRKKKDHLVLLLSMHGHLPDEVELDEILRITPKVAAVIDSEKASAATELDPKRKAFVNMFKAKGLRAHVLERRATENYFTDAAVKQVFGESYRALLPYEKLSDVDPHWGKSQNWRLASPSADEIDKTDLGKFLSSI